MNDRIQLPTAEEKLLVSLCRLEFSKEQITELSALMKEIKDWDHFVRLVNIHGIIALTAFNIHELGIGNYIPEPSMKILDNGHIQSVIRNTWLVQRWKEVNRILSDAGIKHILLKGMALEYSIYGAKGLRQMTDNDILVKKEDALKAWLLLQKNGFRSEMIKSYLHRKIITDIGKHLPTLVKDGYAVEIHHRLFAKAEKNEKLNDAIDNAVEIAVEGTLAYILNDDIHLEYLKEHLHYHQISEESQLRLYLDLELLKPGSAPPFPDGFLAKPEQTSNMEHSKKAYRANFYSLKRGIRFRFLLGDIFPSLRWMKRRHGCGAMKAILLYPGRIGKVMWLLKA